MSEKRRKKGKKKKIIVFAIELVVLVILLIGFFIYSKVGKLDQQAELNPEDLSINNLDSETKQLLEGYTCIALFGVDNRSNGDYEEGNSDSIMIAVINNDTKEVKIVSVYRDTFLNVYDTTYQKANAAYSKGAYKYAVSMLNKNLDLAIVDYVAVDFNAVAEAVDLLGGVEITVTDEEVNIMNGNAVADGHQVQDYIAEIEEVTGKTSSHLSGGGTYNMDGVQALAYSRIRYTAGDDYKRTERQREVISKMVEKAKSASLTTLNSLVNNLFPLIKTSLSNKDILVLASNAMSYELDGTQGWPFNLTSGTFGSRGSLVVPCDLATNVTDLHRFLFDETSYTPSSTVQGISDKIVNETGCTVNSSTRDENPLDAADTTGVITTDDAAE